MYCQHCGYQVAATHKFCEGCGKALPAHPMPPMPPMPQVNMFGMQGTGGAWPMFPMLPMLWGMNRFPGQGPPEYLPIDCGVAGYYPYC